MVRVNDRGPYVKDRIIDLSKHGAQLLGYMGQGTTKVKVEILEKESKALKAAMLNEPLPEREKALAAAESATPAPSLYESSAERVEVSKAESEKMSEIYASAGDNVISTGSYKPQGKTAEPVVYGSAATAEGEIRSGSLGQVNEISKVSDNNGVYGKAAANPQAVSTQAVTSRGYQYQQGYYYIQAGAFSRYDLAHRQMVRLKEYGSSHIMNISNNGKTLYRVVVGPFSQREEAVVAQAKLKYYGITDTRIEQK